MSSWSGKVVIVTGGSSGLGLRDRGHVRAQGAGGDRRRGADALQQTAAELSRHGNSVTAIVTDVTRQDSVDALIAQTIARFGRIDVLVNNAGRSSRRGALETTPEDFAALVELNLLGLVAHDAGRGAAPVGHERPPGKYRIAGRQVGHALHGGVSGQQVRRIGLFAAVAIGTRARGFARAAGLSRPDLRGRTARPTANEPARTWAIFPRSARKPGAGKGEAAAAGRAGRENRARLRITAAGTGAARQGAATVCHLGAIATLGRLAGAEDDRVAALRLLHDRRHMPLPVDLGQDLGLVDFGVGFGFAVQVEGFG